MIKRALRALHRLFYLYNNYDITYFILTHPVSFPCGRPERPERIHDFRQSVD